MVVWLLNMNKAFVIAEIGINHNGNFNLAKLTYLQQNRADAVKFQTHITEKRVDKNSPIFDILKNVNCHFPIFKTKKFSESKKIEFMSTPLMKKVLFSSKKRLKLRLHHLIQ